MEAHSESPSLHSRAGVSGAHIATAVGVAALLGTAWLALTLINGLNYHLFPAVIAGAPAAVVNFMDGRSPDRARLLKMMAIGLASVALGWTVLQVLGSAPTATFVENQPGGARLEALILAIAGSLYGRRRLLPSTAAE